MQKKKDISNLMKRPEKFKKSLTECLSIPEKSLEQIQVILNTGKLFRYNKKDSYVNKLEVAISAYLNIKYTLCVNSGGSAIHLALKSLDLKPDDIILMNEFTLAPVPGAVDKVGSKLEYVKNTKDLIMDLEDLEFKIINKKPKVLLLSYMRGFYPDIEKVCNICKRYNVKIIEDAAHTLGVKFKDKFLGCWGDIGCYSLQSYKQINAGEGGIIVTNNDELSAKQILLSGSYMFYQEHTLKPDKIIFDNIKLFTPNYSSRYNEIAASIALSQVPLLDERNNKWRHDYFYIKNLLSDNELISFPNLIDSENFVPTSILFYLNIDPEKIETFLDETHNFNLNIKWFGVKNPIGFTSNIDHWKFTKSYQKSNNFLKNLFDIRLPINLDNDDLVHLSKIINWNILECLK